MWAKWIHSPNVFIVGLSSRFASRSWTQQDPLPQVLLPVHSQCYMEAPNLRIITDNTKSCWKQFYYIKYKELGFFKELLSEHLLNKNKYWWHFSKWYLKQEKSWNTLFTPEKWPTSIRKREMDVTRILHFEEWLSYQIMKREELSPAWGAANPTSSGVSGGAQG